MASRSSNERSSSGLSEIIFLGTGSSTGVPTPLCVTQPTDPPCAVCHKALAEPPERNPNYRCNPSLMIRYRCRSYTADGTVTVRSDLSDEGCDSNGVAQPSSREAADGSGGDSALLTDTVKLTGSVNLTDSVSLDLSPGEEWRHIQIDAGKCFREQVLRWFVHCKIPTIDALILTHEHADAILGLDDVRGLQRFPRHAADHVEPLSVFLSRRCMASVRDKFPYLTLTPPRPAPSLQPPFAGPPAAAAAAAATSATAAATGDQPCGVVLNSSLEGRTAGAGGMTEGGERGVKKVSRRVSRIDWQIIQQSVVAPFNAAGLTVTPLPVEHGEDYIALGFEFGSHERVVYMSDVSRIPDTTLAYLKARQQLLGQIHILVIDSLYFDHPHATHFHLPQTLDAIRSLRPKNAFIVGMTHEFDHHKVNLLLREWSTKEEINVKLAHDGLCIPVLL